jgi:hypothetical protein
MLCLPSSFPEPPNDAPEFHPAGSLDRLVDELPHESIKFMDSSKPSFRDGQLPGGVPQKSRELLDLT